MCVCVWVSWHTLIFICQRHISHTAVVQLPTFPHSANGRVTVFFSAHSLFAARERTPVYQSVTFSNWAAALCTSYHTSTAGHKQQCVCVCVCVCVFVITLRHTHSARRESHARGGKARAVRSLPGVREVKGEGRGGGGGGGSRVYMQLWGLTLTQSWVRVSR